MPDLRWAAYMHFLSSYFTSTLRAEGKRVKRQGKFVDTNTEPNAYHSERPAAKKGVFHQTRGGKLERPKHPGSWRDRQPSRADKKQTLREQAAWVSVLTLPWGRWATLGKLLVLWIFLIHLPRSVSVLSIIAITYVHSVFKTRRSKSGILKL